MRTIALFTTGGTIEKVYDERNGVLENQRSIIDRMLARLRLAGTHVRAMNLLSKDSLHMTDADRAVVLSAVQAALLTDVAGIVIGHGTDTLHLTGELLCKALPAPRCPIVLTGAMRPFEMRRSDALQNLTEAIFATGVVSPGVYCVFHGQALRFPGVQKNRELGTFQYAAHASTPRD
jgi:L-asparaginase